MRSILNFFKNIYNNKKSLLIFIFLISVFCSLIFLSFFRDLGPSEHGVPGTDYFVYYEPIANNIIQGKGATIEGRVPITIGLGYPIILSGIFAFSQQIGVDKLDLVVMFNIILTAIAAVFLFLIAKEIFNKKIALITSFLWISYPFNLWFLKNPNTEVPFIPLLFAGLWLYVLAFKKGSLRFAFLAGFVLGLASFVRIIGLFLPLFLALLFLFFLKGEPKKRKILLVAVLLLGNLVALLPWGIITFSETGGFVPLSSQGPLSVVVGVIWLSGPGTKEVKEILSDDVMDLIERVKTEDLSSFFKLSRFFGQELINRPVPLLKLIGLKLVRSWYGTSTRWYEEREILAVQILYLIAGFLGLIIYVIKTAKTKTRDMIFLLGPVFYFWMMAFFSVSIMRYMIPAMGLIIIFSAITVSILIDKIKFSLK